MTILGTDRIGPYDVVRTLAEGGMGRVYLARRSSEGGFELTCVLKTVRPDISDQDRYGRMFNQEARIGALLRHQNIVQVFDFAREGRHVLPGDGVRGRP